MIWRCQAPLVATHWLRTLGVSAFIQHACVFLLNCVPPAGFLYPFRHPKPKGAVEGFLYGLGSVLRNVGAAMDDLGSMIQGPGGQYKDEGEQRLAALAPPSVWSLL